MSENLNRFGLGLTPDQNTAQSVNQFDLDVARRQREASTSTMDYVRSIYRQDSFVPGALAELAGSELQPDPAYNPLQDPELAQMASDIPEEYMPYLWRTHSKAHAIYTLDRIREKLADQERLEDLGIPGNIGRLALGFLMPETLLSFGAAYAVSRGSQAIRGLAYTRGTRGLSRTAAEAEARAAQIASQSTRGSVALGVGAGAAESYAFEAYRQSVVFEDSEALRVAAGIMGGLFTLPFAVAGARTARRTMAAAEQEAAALRALADANEGKELTREQIQTITDLHERTKTIEALEQGNLTQEEALQAIERLAPKAEPVEVPELMGPFEPDEMFLNRLQERTRAMAQEIIEKNRLDSYYARQRMKRQERAFRIKAEKEERAKVLRMKQAEEQAGGPTLADLQTPPVQADSALAAALKKAFGTEDPAGAVRLQRDSWEPRVNALADDIKAQQAEIARLKEDAWRQAEEAEAARRAAEAEKAYIARELFDAQMRDPFEGPEAAPEVAAQPAPEPPRAEPAEPPKAEPVEPPKAEPVEAPEATPEVSQAAPEAKPSARLSDKEIAESLVGQQVSWLDIEEGIMEGEVVRINQFAGGMRAVIKMWDGSLKSVDPKTLDEWPREAPDGFLPDSIGAAHALPIQLLEDVDKLSSRFTGYAAVPGTNGKVKVPVRFDLFAFLNESENPVVRSLANVLIRDPVGFKDKTRGQSMTASEWRDQIRRTVGGAFHLEARDAAREAMRASGVPFWNKSAFNAKFYEAVSIYTRGDDSVLQEFPPAAHAAIKRASAAQKRAYDQMLTNLKNAGVEGAQQVDPNAAYVNRVWRHDKIRAAIDKHGEDNVVQLLADSFFGMSARGPLTGNLDKARSFLRAVRKLEFSPGLQDIHLAARDMGTLREELRLQGLADQDIDAIVDVMFEAKAMDDSQLGKPGNLRARMAIDETAALQTPAGTLRIHDLVENDARMLVDRYMQTMGGHYGLARVGFYSPADFRAKIREARDYSLEHNLGDRYAREERWLEDIFKHITGKPMSVADYSGTARFFTAFRGYTRSVMLGQLGLTAAFELKQAIGVMGMRAFMKQLPSFGAWIRAIRDGYIPEPGLARQIVQISGHGSEMAAAYARAREISEDLPADMLKGIEHWSNRFSHATDIISGNASFTSVTRQLSAKMSIQFLHDMRVLTPEVRARLAGFGLEGQWADDVVNHLRQYAVTRDGVVEELRLDDWMRNDPDTYEAFQVYVGRQVRDVIQDHDIGETMPFMHSTLGKLFGELKTFFFVAHAKNLLKNLHYADGTTINVLLYGMLGEALSYSVQQAINAPDKLDERLSPEVMGPAVMARMAALGFGPMILETGYQLVTGESLLAPESTSSGSNNRNLFMTPSFQVLGALTAVPGIAVQTALGTQDLTPGDVKTLSKAVPLGNTYGVRGMVNWLAEAQQ
ncbi:MAG: hypothetical protein ACK4K3_07420 [Aquabacterium sp.]